MAEPVTPTVPPLVVRYVGPAGRTVRSMLFALRNDLYEIDTGMEPDDDGLPGLMLKPKPSGRDEEHPVPTISFRVANAPLLPPHDPVATAIALLTAPTIGGGEAKRIRNALLATGSSSRTGPSSPSDTILCMCATPWSDFSISESAGLIHAFPRFPLDHDGIVEAMLPQVVNTSMSGTDLDRTCTRKLTFMPFAAYVDSVTMMDPMAIMRSISELQASPIRSFQP